MKRIALLLSIGILLPGCFVAAEAQAAYVTFTSPVHLLLTSPTTTLTIATGSVADLVTLNATSVAVSMLGGETFTLLSASYDLSIATSRGGGSVSNTCANGIVTAALSQTTGSTIYTVAPGGTTCANASPSVITDIAVASITTDSATITWTTNVAADSTVSYGASVSYGATSTDPTLVTAHSISLSNLNANTIYRFAVISTDYGTSTISGDNTFTTAAVTRGGGGSVGVPSAYGSPYAPGTAIIASPSASSSPASFATTSISSSNSTLEAELNSLLAELVALQAEAGESISTPGSSAPFIFIRNLYFGISRNDVKQLQAFLISQNDGPAARKLAAHGTTKHFATLTLNALIEFQKNADIKPAMGYFGPITRAYVNNLEERSNTTNQS
jgi:hypothetical protein